MESSQHNSKEALKNEEVSLKDLVLKFQEWARYLLSKWLIILIFGIMGASLGTTYAYFKKVNYTAELTFVMEESKSNALGAYAGLASQFGIDLGNMGASGVFSGDNILVFLKSRLLVEKTLLSTVKYGEKQTNLLSIYIEANELDKKWSRKLTLKNVSFLPAQDRKYFSLVQDSLLKTIYTRITTKELEIGKSDKKSGFISVKTVSASEFFAKVFTELLVKEATSFYVASKMMRSKTYVDKMQEKADSLEQLLNRKTYSAAVTQDINMNPAKRIATVGAELATRDKMVLQTMFGEVIKNLEMSKMAMAQETPIIQIIDTPMLPLDKVKMSMSKGLLMGGFLGVFFIVALLIGIRIYANIMG